MKPNSNQRTDNIAVTAKEMMQRDYVSIGEGYIVFPSSMGPYYTYGGTRYRYKEVCAYTQDGIILTGHKYVVDVD